LFKSENYSNFKIVQISNLLKFKIVLKTNKTTEKTSKKTKLHKAGNRKWKKHKKTRPATGPQPTSPRGWGAFPHVRGRQLGFVKYYMVL
jgi:hypothetical protein